MAEAAEKKAPRLSELEEKPGEKAPKAGKPAIKDNKVKQKGKKEKKKMGAGMIILLVSLVWLFLISAAMLLVLFDPTEGGAIRGPVLLFLNPKELPREEYYAEEIFAIQDALNDIETRLAELDRKSDELDLREEALDERESLVEEREALAEDLIEQYNELLAAAAAGTGGDIPMAAKIFESMTPATAARTLEVMDFDIAFGIIRLINKKYLGPIFDAMSTDMAAEYMAALGTPPELPE